MAAHNMYSYSDKQWNPFVGCEFKCGYCHNSFQAQLKRYGKKNCQDCYHFKPHTHPKRFNDQLPRTKYLQFIFTCANGDISFCQTDYLTQIVARITKEKVKNFLIQSKNPATFNRITFPENVILGTTLETNRDSLYEGVSAAPKPIRRYKDFLTVKHPLKMVTIEPVIDFDLPIMLEWMQNIKPVMIWLGYDSKKSYLPEPELAKVKELYWKLGTSGFTVMLKTIREAKKQQ